MTAVGDGNFLPQRDLRTAVAPLNGHGSQTAQGIGGSHRSGGLLHPRCLLGKMLPELGKDLVFQCRQPILGGEYLIFQLLQLLGDVALAVGKGLLADVVFRHLIHKGLGYLNIIAEYPVEAHLQGADAGFFPFGGFNGGDGAGAAFHNISQPVGFFAGALADDAALPDGQGGIVHNGLLDHAGAVIQRINGLFQLLQQGGGGLAQLCLHKRQRPKTPGKPQKIPAVDGAGDHPGHHPFQIRHIPKGFFQLPPENHIVHQILHGFLPTGDFQRIQQGLFQPAAEHPPAHGGVGLVQNPQQGAFFLLGAHGLRQLQIPPGIQIQLHEFAGGVVLQLADVSQTVFLNEQQGLQQSSCGNHGGRQIGNAHLDKGRPKV